MQLKIWSLVAVAILSLGCEQKPNAATPQESETADSSKVSIAQLEAELKVLEAMQSGIGEMVRASQTSAVAQEGKSDAYIKPDTRTVGLLFSANNQGERLDCGCKRRPLGGLARRKTMIDHASNPDPLKRNTWWGDVPLQSFNVSVDAGNLFFKNELLSTNAPAAQKVAKYDAESVALAMAKIDYDIVNVGALDLAFGIEHLQALYKKAKIDAISANLYQGGERPFEPYRVITHDGFRIAFVGLLKEKPRTKDYYVTRRLTVRPAAVELEALMPTLKNEADVIVVVSNLGLPDSQRLVETVKPENRPDLVLVSDTNRLTQSPQYVVGVPLVEPMSRGKYFGKVDLFINGDDVDFANAKEDPRDVLTQYGRAWRNYLSGRIRLNRAVREAAELEYKLAARAQNVTLEQSQTGTNGAPNKRSMKLEKQLDGVRKRIETLAKGREGSSATLIKVSVSVENLRNQTTTGDDFIQTTIAAVDIKIPEAKDVERIVAKREKRRPE